MKIKIKNEWRLNALVDEKKYTSMKNRNRKLENCHRVCGIVHCVL